MSFERIACVVFLFCIFVGNSLSADVVTDKSSTLQPSNDTPHMLTRPAVAMQEMSSSQQKDVQTAAQQKSVEAEISKLQETTHSAAGAVFGTVSLSHAPPAVDAAKAVAESTSPSDVAASSVSITVSNIPPQREASAVPEVQKDMNVAEVVDEKIHSSYWKLPVALSFVIVGPAVCLYMALSRQARKAPAAIFR
eukprot:GILJ01003201.1.p1 GENE.GILJ01003201.1~~GILJ01003201.1.p1  ORF type:complete len:194 (+),score=35.97 GILJ01003201.1:136-717(+)